jgi:peptide chain release factor 3
LREELELLQGASHPFDAQAYLAGRQTPVFFGSAVSSFGVEPLLDFFVENAPAPQEQGTQTRTVTATETELTGFVFKIQANMDPKHRDRVGFMRVCSGHYKPGDQLFHVRSGKNLRVSDALTFMASDRTSVTDAYPGDIVGLKNYGTISVGDTFTQGESLQFTGLPSFAPELFRRPQLRDPLRAKALQKGVDQLCEEGAAQLFRPLSSNDLILGAIGVLQFDVVAYRLRDEYNVEAKFEAVNVVTARWVSCEDEAKFKDFRDREARYLAIDAAGSLAYLAPSMANLQVTQDRWPDIQFTTTRDIG